MRKILLPLLLFILIFLIGCNKKVYNSLGLEVIETTNYVRIDKEIVDLRVASSNYDCGIIFLIFENENISFDVNGIDHIISVGNDKNNNGFDGFTEISLNYLGIKEQIIKVSIDTVLETSFMDIIIRENGFIIGYSIIRLDIDKKEQNCKMSVFKTIIFPKLKKQKIVLTKNIVNQLIEEEKSKLQLNNIICEFDANIVRLHINTIWKETITKKNYEININDYYKQYKFSIYLDYGSLSSSQDGIKVGTLGNSYGGSETSNINFYIFPKQDDAGNYCQVPDFKITILVKDQSEIIGYVIIEVVDSEKSDKVKDINIIHQAAFMKDLYDGSDDYVLRYINNKFNYN